MAEAKMQVGDKFHIVGTGLERYRKFRDDILKVQSVSFSHAENPAYDDEVGKGAAMYSADGGRVNVYEWEAEYISPEEIESV
ncbi:hypothetical protein 010DV004_282 [Bacillus phage 010DV004]|nr:hypothetical protein 010DV004_17 [Bacillus phage 010DV004]QZA69235.1 hypothetical protein 010DV005_17 [Bacillus phage 010DV005]QZA69803.1 hypothetical protein 043JT007_17 [Bacillus phage 043JT007]QZA69214.1 hypothetical protein 010DV004_282 [Bacillus phage 010DV004]QZA69495.1 hypothetical protein 010DV005_283 [Bacillus phage 010DV005]